MSRADDKLGWPNYIQAYMRRTTQEAEERFVDPSEYGGDWQGLNTARARTKATTRERVPEAPIKCPSPKRK